MQFEKKNEADKFFKIMNYMIYMVKDGPNFNYNIQL